MRSLISLAPHILLLGFLPLPFLLSSLLPLYPSSLALRLFSHHARLPDLASFNSLLAAHLRSGPLDRALRLFDQMPRRDVVTWTCVIHGLARRGDCRGALRVFRAMLESGAAAQPNRHTLTSVLYACAKLGALEQGEWAHAYAERRGMALDAVLGTSLVDMYCKCGSLERALEVFDRMGDRKDVTAWTAMISGLAMHGHVHDCIDLFERMIGLGVTPNSVTFLGLLSGCTHGGLVKNGEEYFFRMREEFGIEPTIEHYGCMVDLYAKSGLISKAWDVANTMPMKPDALIWGALLSGSQKLGDISTSEAAAKQLAELEPTNSSAYILLSNVYAKMRRFDDVKKVRALMDELGVKKTPGCSLVEVDGRIHEFFVGDRSHPDTWAIYMMLDEIMERLRLAGYVGSTEAVFLDLDEEGKEMALSLHSEKLAIAFCFTKTKPGTTIRIFKNLRICMDCHVAIKLISKIYEREIVVRDGKRFHHFRGGSCSCKDFW
ncbi:pentatricopeptide repeat-containing protein At3g62890 [Ananas comosus]|uniref:Pentatricopeptide repeat-containing protein At3g62890 n=1 Tax=Ananas comosus TaxID=4615 RepID=A0A6P5EQW5_ANACO|nr:pentatricopeptide repeat-containing protein At3g62890 [Ananas comosus]